eukprot:scaffold246_cov414-Prasinococcus_capsulatus_cf.AAC.22
MVFVYQGGGKRLRKDADACEVVCAKKSRDLQWCLSRHSFNQDPASKLIGPHCPSVGEGPFEEWKRCCQKASEMATSTDVQ